MRPFSWFVKLYILLGVIYGVFITVFEVSDPLYNVFGVLLTVMPLLGFVFGILVGKQWGGIESMVGRSLLSISLSLLAWALGQGVFFYYSMTLEEIPYPGLPDYFFIFIDPFYALALLAIMKYAGAKSNMKTAFAYLLLLVVPLASIYINYYLFFGELSIFSEIDSAVVFDLIYTFGSIAIMALTVITVALSIRTLGGKMRVAIYMFFLGFALQYAGDIFYSMLEAQGISYVGSLSDLIYFLSIASVTLGLLKMNAKSLDGVVSSAPVLETKNGT